MSFDNPRSDPALDVARPGLRHSQVRPSLRHCRTQLSTFPDPAFDIPRPSLRHFQTQPLAFPGRTQGTRELSVDHVGYRNALPLELIHTPSLAVALWGVSSNYSFPRRCLVALPVLTGELAHILPPPLNPAARTASHSTARSPPGGGRGCAMEEKLIEEDGAGLSPPGRWQSLLVRWKNLLRGLASLRLWQWIREYCQENGLLTLSIFAVVIGCVLGFLLRSLHFSTQVRTANEHHR